VRDLYLDEVDNFPLDVDGEGDPSKLAEARQTTFTRRKRLRTSTPTTKDFSRIEAAFEATDRCYFHVACPHCGAYQRLELGAKTPHGLKWDKDAAGAPIVTSVRYVCVANGCEIKEHHKRTMLAGGVWIAERPGAQAGKVRGFHLNGLYSPIGWLAWSLIATEWHEANVAASRGDLSLLRVFVNTRLAETFEETGDRADSKGLRERAADIPVRVVDHGHFVCTMAVDTQGDRLEAYVWAWGRGMARQLVDRAVFYGDPNQPESVAGSPWAQLTEYRRTPIMHAAGQVVPILAAFVDSGGHSTQAVYAYSRAYRDAHVYAVRGASQSGKPILGKPNDIDVTWQGTRHKRGVKVWPIGTDTAKAEIYARMRIAEPGPGYVLLSKHLPPEVFEQITSERMVTRYVKGRPRLEWIKPPGKRNEALDCAVYALAAAHYVGIDRWQAGDWAKWEVRATEPPPKPAAPALRPAEASPRAAPQRASQPQGRAW
jgi:phage terminase large subunit GpA-like protein